MGLNLHEISFLFAKGCINFLPFRKNDLFHFALPRSLFHNPSGLLI